MFGVILSNGDRAEATSESNVLFAASTLVREAAAHGGASSILRRDIIVTRDGVYNAALTLAARAGRATT